MLRLTWKPLGILACGTILALYTAITAPDAGTTQPAETQPQDQKESPGADVFGLDRVWKIHLELTAEEWQKMQPTTLPIPGAPPGFGGPRRPQPPGTQPAREPSDPPDVETHEGGFGMEFPWARASLSAGGQAYPNVGIRYKGNFTYMASAAALRRPLKIDFDRYDEKQQFHGLKKINLNNGITDPARAREALSYAIFRAANVPAPRTAYAELTLTVPGKYDREYVGLYTLVEQVDKTFLKTHFSSGKGLLLKPEGIRGLEYLGDDWPPYQERYIPKDEAPRGQQRRLISFVRLVNQADDARFRSEIPSHLDVDEFLRFLAVNVLLSNLDSFLAFGHNYYLYLRPDTSQFTFIPWDVDLSVATWPAGGMPEQQMDLSISHPHAGENKLIDRLLAMDDVKPKYLGLLQELTATCFTKERWLADLARIEKITAGPLNREATAARARGEGAGMFGFGPPGGGMFPGMAVGLDYLKTFIDKRTESIAAQLEGKRDGYEPIPFFGPGRPGGPQANLGPGGTPGGFNFRGPPGPFNPGGPPGGFGLGGPPGGFGPGGLLAHEILRRADLDKNGALTREELSEALQNLIADVDLDKNGSLDVKELAEAINALFPPPNFGPGGPGGFGPGSPAPPPGGFAPRGFGPGGPGPQGPTMPSPQDHNSRS